MCILEHELLVDRKKRCWDRYYNNSLGDPRYVDISGENHPLWKGGISYDSKTYHREYMREWNKTPKGKEYNKEYMRNYQQTPTYKEYQREYQQKPEYKEYRREYMKAYHLRNREKILAQKKEYNREYYLRNKEKIRAERKEYMKEYRLRKKAERQGENTLDRFME